MAIIYLKYILLVSNPQLFLCVYELIKTDLKKKVANVKARKRQIRKAEKSVLKTHITKYRFVSRQRRNVLKRKKTGSGFFDIV